MSKASKIWAYVFRVTEQVPDFNDVEAHKRVMAWKLRFMETKFNEMTDDEFDKVANQ